MKTIIIRILPRAMVARMGGGRVLMHWGKGGEGGEGGCLYTRAIVTLFI